MFKDILTFLGLDYRDAPLKAIYLDVLGISIPKDLMNRKITNHKRIVVRKVKNQHVLNGLTDILVTIYRVATLSKST